MRYNPAFIAYREILSSKEKAYLQDLATFYPLATFQASSRDWEEMAIDFIYTSAKIEGNTYDRIDTDNLIRIGITAGGKRYSDAVMILNLRRGFEWVMDSQPETVLDLNYLCTLHKMLMRDLLPSHEQGLCRDSGVTIGATRYRPPADPGTLRTEIKALFAEAEKYDNPFELSIYLHCNLAYLQYFRDGNKRTARMMQTAALVRGKTLPLFFNESLIGTYQRAVINYYETGDYKDYVHFFKTNYRMTIADLTGKTVKFEEKLGEKVER